MLTTEAATRMLSRPIIFLRVPCSSVRCNVLHCVWKMGGIEFTRRSLFRNIKCTRDVWLNDKVKHVALLIYVLYVAFRIIIQGAYKLSENFVTP
jgi:hypothetical protein